MPYNDEQIRKDEERFKEHLEKARSLTKEDMETLISNMEVLAANAIKLAAINVPTPKEAALLERIKKMLKEATEHLSYMQNILGESTKRQAYAYYLHIKKLAADGDPEALKIYEDLKPDYQASLRSDIGDN